MRIFSRSLSSGLFLNCLSSPRKAFISWSIKPDKSLISGIFFLYESDALKSIKYLATTQSAARRLSRSLTPYLSHSTSSKVRVSTLTGSAGTRGFRAFEKMLEITIKWASGMEEMASKVEIFDESESLLKLALAVATKRDMEFLMGLY